MSLLIKNGEIVTAAERYVADIYCDSDTITRIDKNIPAPAGAEVIDASGKYVFPGFIDPHVHIYLPFMGTFAKDTHETASQAALVGGTTTFIEMICPGRTEKPLEAFELWLGKARGKSACDFTFHMGVSRYDAEAERDFREIVKRGVSSFKVFLAYKGALGVTDEELFHALRLARELGVITTAHCENADLVLELQKKLLAEGKTGPEYHYWSRPPRVEAEGVHHLMTFAEILGAHVYIVHVSCAEALSEAVRGAGRGARVWVETLIQYLLCDKTDAEKPDFEGAKFVMSPPLRESAKPGGAVERTAPGLRVHAGHGPRAVRFQDAKTNGAGRFHENPQRHPVAGGPDQFILYLRGEGRADRPASIRQHRQHAGRQNLRPFSARRGRSSPARTPTWWCTIRPTRGKSPRRPSR